MPDVPASAIPGEALLRLSELPWPRQATVAELLGEILAIERGLADLYEEFARRTPLRPLGDPLAALAREKRTRLAALAPLARACGLDGAGLPVAGPSPAAAERRTDLFARGFQGERDVELRARELALLLGEIGVPPGLADLPAEAARHRARLRELYLKYS
jgi:hypothetical protein